MRLWLSLALAICSRRGAQKHATRPAIAGARRPRSKIVECGGAEAEVHTAKAFRVMARAASKAGIELRFAQRDPHVREAGQALQLSRAVEENSSPRRPAFSPRERPRARHQHHERQGARVAAVPRRAVRIPSHGPRRGLALEVSRGTMRSTTGRARASTARLGRVDRRVIVDPPARGCSRERDREHATARVRRVGEPPAAEHDRASCAERLDPEELEGEVTHRRGGAAVLRAVLRRRSPASRGGSCRRT